MRFLVDLLSRLRFRLPFGARTPQCDLVKLVADFEVSFLEILIGGIVYCHSKTVEAFDLTFDQLQDVVVAVFRTIREVSI